MNRCADPSSWEVVLVRCPGCERTVLAEAADQHLALHFLRDDL